MRTKLLIYSLMALLILSCTDNNENEEPEIPIPETPIFTDFKTVDTIILPEMKRTITEMKEKIPDAVISQFESKFNIWEEALTQKYWMSHWPAQLSTQYEEFNDLIVICQSYEKAIWPLALEKLVISLFEQPDFDFNNERVDKPDSCLYCSRIVSDMNYWHFWILMADLGAPKYGRDFFCNGVFSLYQLADLAYQVLEEEKDNILRSIMAIPEQDTEAFETNTVTVSDQNILIK